MPDKKSISFSIGMLMAAATGLPSPVHAAAALEEVIVTARKTEEASQSVPISLTALSGDDLEKRGAVDFQDLAKGNPGVKIAPGGSGSVVGSTVAIRGNVQNEVTFQADAAVGTYVDGLIVSRTFGMNGSMVDVESVQTFKGPQGTLFGRNTTGGAIVVQTRNPEDVLGGYVKTEAGSFGLRHATAVLNVPLNDIVALRLVGDVSDQDAWAHGVDGRDWGDAESSTYRVKMSITPNDDTTILLSAESVDVEGTAPINEASQPNRQTYNNIPEFVSGMPIELIRTDEKNSAKAKTYSLNASHDTGWGEVKFIAGKRELDVGLNVSLPPLLASSRQDKPDNDQASYELQVNGSALDDTLQLTSGLYYFDETTNEDQTTLDLAGAIATRSIAEMNTTSRSAYFQGIYALTDAANVTFGGRFTRDWREMTGSYNGDPLDYSKTNKRFNYLISFDYSFADDKMIYASHSTGYRAGTAGISPDNADPTQWAPLKAESVVNYEVGAKTEWFNRRLRVNMALYRQDYSDYQATIIILGPAGVVRGYENLDATIEGGEVDVTFAPAAGVLLGGTYSYIDAKTDDGRRLAAIPRSDYSLYISKTLDLSFGELELRADYAWRDSWFSQLASPEASDIEDVGLLNLNATLNTNDWRLSVYAKNATDERYYTYINYLEIAGIGTLLNQAYLGMPRTFGASVQYNF